MNSDKQRTIFNRWLSNYKGVLFKVIRAYAFNEHDRDDLFQEISIQLWNSIANFKGDAAESTWIYRVALYSALTWSRKDKKHKDVTKTIGEKENLLIEKEKDKDNRLEWLYEQIGSLNEIDRSLTLLMLDGFSYRDMASISGISESNVGVKINRIKKHLIQKSKEDFHGV